MIFGMAACGLTPKIDHAGMDPAIYDKCPDDAQSRRPGALAERNLLGAPAGTEMQTPEGAWVILENGIWFVPLDEANARENTLIDGARIFRSMWVDCLSVVKAARQRDEGLAD